MSDTRNEWVRLLANYGHIGFTFVACIVIGMGGGILLDQKVFAGKTTPWFTFIGLAFGILASFKTLFDILIRENKKKVEQDDRESGG